MSFQVKFQFKIRQKCRSKWNDIGHTLELIPKTIKTTENYSRLFPLDAGMHRKVPKYTDIDNIRKNMHS